VDSILFIVVIAAAMYFLMIRPQQKRAKEQKEKMAALEAGARVMTISGIVGTIRHLGDKQAILEVAPGVELVIDKRAISTQAVEDEFEFADEADADDETVIEDQVEGYVEPSNEELDLEPADFDPTPESATFDPTPPAEPTEEPRKN
jgi:preprotein translocase subunit YajC